MTRRDEETEGPQFVKPKAEWGEGPWQDEPDRVEWRHASGYALLMVRGAMGHWCGYVGLPPGHPWHGAGTDVDVNVHGGLTYADACNGHVCHVPAPGEPDDVWWLGFDCGHCFDMFPTMQAPFMGTYRALDYVMSECESLGDQALAAAKAPRVESDE